VLLLLDATGELINKVCMKGGGKISKLKISPLHGIQHGSLIKRIKHFTILKLIATFYIPRKAEVFYRNISMQSVKRNAISANIQMVSLYQQNPSKPKPPSNQQWRRTHGGGARIQRRPQALRAEWNSICPAFSLHSASRLSLSAGSGH
jgi:hypothetical protein